MADNRRNPLVSTWNDILSGAGPPLYGDTINHSIPGLPENMFRHYRPMAAPNIDQRMIYDINDDPRFRMQTMPSWLGSPDIPVPPGGLGGVYPGLGGRGMALMMNQSPPTLPGGETLASVLGRTNTPLGSQVSPTTPTNMLDWLSTYLSKTRQ